MEDKHLEQPVYSSPDIHLQWADEPPPPPLEASFLWGTVSTAGRPASHSKVAPTIWLWWQHMSDFHKPLLVDSLTVWKETHRSTWASGFSSFLRAHCWNEVLAWTCTCLSLPPSQTFTEILLLVGCEYGFGPRFVLMLCVVTGLGFSSLTQGCHYPFYGLVKGIKWEADASMHMDAPHMLASFPCTWFPCIFTPLTNLYMWAPTMYETLYSVPRIQRDKKWSLQRHKLFEISPLKIACAKC